MEQNKNDKAKSLVGRLGTYLAKRYCDCIIQIESEYPKNKDCIKEIRYWQSVRDAISNIN